MRAFCFGFHLVFLSVLLVFLQNGSLFADESNLALGKKYALYPSPNYRLCTDPDDGIQLTDGQTTQSYFWTQKGTVGWQGAPYATITVDLGRVESIGKFEFTTAAGVAGVVFPRAVYVHVSDDGETYRKAAELVEEDFLKNGEFPEKYAIRCLESRNLETRGRFVRFLILTSGTFAFCDEVRVFRGAKSADEICVAEPTVGSAEDVFKAERISLCLSQRFRADFAGLCGALRAADVAEDVKASLTFRALRIVERALRIVGRAPETFAALPKDFKTILPIGAEHEALYRVQAELWKAEGCPSLTFAPFGIWDLPNRFQAPPKQMASKRLSVTAMQNEKRPAVFNVFNATQKTQNVQLEISGLEDAADVAVYRVLWTDTNVCEPVPCALAEVLPDSAQTFTIPVEPGLVQQVWLSFGVKKDLFVCEKSETDGKSEGDEKSEPASQRTFCGTVFCRCPELSVEESLPVELTVYPLTFPEKTTLMLGGWDYVDGKGAYSVNELNRPAFLKHLQERHVNAPWGRREMLMKCSRNADGVLELDASEFDAWLECWPVEKVSEYFIFMSLGDWSSKTTEQKFMGATVGSEEFRTLVGEWLGAWREHWKKRGISPERINFLLHDEPNESMADLSAFQSWSAAIREACPGLKVWEDPCYRDLAKAPREFFEACSVLCPNRPMWLSAPKDFDDFYLAQRDAGRELALYSCSGPLRLLDPYAYCLLQAWDAARIGARSSFFWAMGDGLGVSSWNEYFLGGNSYTPLFLDPDDPNVTAGRHMEAIALSAQDFEYVVMLRKRIEELAKTNPERADAMTHELESLIQKTLANAGGKSLEWKKRRDRSLADAARIRILEMLTERR